MGSPRVLIVDDDPANLAALTKILVKNGMETATAEDGLEALAMLRADPGHFNVLLLDRMMPRMDGLELLRRIKHSAGLRSLPVVLQTALTSGEEIMEGLLAGAYYYLTKPLNKNMVVAVVRTAAEDQARRAILCAELERAYSALPMMDQGSFRYQTLTQCHELTNLLAKACPESDRTVVGLSELMINALEHGNLGISYLEKTELVTSHGWRAEVERRQQLPENVNKWVKVGFTRTASRIRFEIEDQGAGFNWRQYIVPSPARIFDNHGRGILLAKMDVFDQIEYQGNGNRVVADVMVVA
jgi:CheY-like chemotaxis protein